MTLLAVLPSPVLAEDLLCTGTIWAGAGQSAEGSRVLSFDASTLRASTSSFQGDVSGTLKAKPDVYIGWLRNETGAEYWINLDRYTGKFSMMVYANGQFQNKVEFMGTCRRAERQF